MFKTLANSLKNKFFMTVVVSSMSLLYGAELKFEEIAPSYIEINAIIWHKSSKAELLEYVLEVEKNRGKHV